jgi:predicted O-methyltransferase YrrM
MLDLATKQQNFERAKREVATLSHERADIRSELNSFERRSRFSFYSGISPVWWMEHADKAAIIALMNLIKPRIVIEIGSLFGGSTCYFAEHAVSVYCLDIDPAVATRCSDLKNVEVIIGSSKDELPKLIGRLPDGFDLVLVDGDHSAEGVKADLDSLLAERPRHKAWIVMHDSFNPEVRRGILSTDWTKPWVHNLEVDFVPGNIMSERHVLNEMWGGVAVAELSAEDRVGPMQITKNADLLFRAAQRSTRRNLITRQVRDLARNVKHAVSS